MSLARAPHSPSRRDRAPKGVILTVAAVALLAVFGANVNSLVPFYAIGVFTGFTMAGLGMARYHHTHREPGWRHRLVINYNAQAGGETTDSIVQKLLNDVPVRKGAADAAVAEVFRS